MLQEFKKIDVSLWLRLYCLLEKITGWYILTQNMIHITYYAFLLFGVVVPYNEIISTVCSCATLMVIIIIYF